MAITHDPDLEAREPVDGDLKMFKSLAPGDQVSFFEWPVEPLTVLEREEDEHIGERVRVEAVGEESFLYEIDGAIWHYVDDQPNREDNPYPVENLVLKEAAEN